MIYSKELFGGDFLMKKSFKIDLYDEEIKNLQKFVDFKNSLETGTKWTSKQTIKILFIQRLEERLRDIE
jgi:hypothetical protein